MEETLTDCLVRVREDLSQLKKVRDYLETNADTQERCSVTWRTIEAFNSILTVCSSQNSPETPALDILLDSFFYLAKNNTENTVWDDFGFELGIICVKVLSAIERTSIFELLFCKLLSIIEIICEFNENIWKTTARQILNVLINKKISYKNLETIVKIYICILKRIDNDALCEFSTQNFHLLKTLSLSVQKIGDFELQMGITQLVYLHLSKNTKLLSDVFEEGYFDFENDVRVFLNKLNKSRKGCDRKVYSICCHVMYLGGCFVEPPSGGSFVWVDANKDTERLSVKYYDFESDNVMNIPFSSLVDVQFDNSKKEGNICLTIKTKNEDNVCLVTENTEEVYEFVRFLQTEINGGRRKKKISKTTDSLVIVRNESGVPQSQELSPKSFVESLDKHIGLVSPELRRLYEDSIETIDFMQKTTPEKGHKLFKSPNDDFCFDDNKENVPVEIKTYTRKSKTVVETNSEEYFRGSSVSKKKPYLPRLKRSRRSKKQDEDPKPSLLDPNGYAYQRWCKPTTSERSNFWLKKLDTLQKPKTDSNHVFDFSDESDSIFGKRKKRRVVHSKRKCRTKKETRQTSLREVKAILKKASPIREKVPPAESEYESVAEDDEAKPRKLNDQDRQKSEFGMKKRTLRVVKKASVVAEKKTREPPPEEEQKASKPLPKTAHRMEKHQEKDKQTEFRTTKGTKQTSREVKQQKEPPPEEEQPKNASYWDKIAEDRRHDEIIRTFGTKKDTKGTSGVVKKPSPVAERESTPEIEPPPEEGLKHVPKSTHRCEKLQERDRQIEGRTRKGTKDTSGVVKKPSPVLDTEIRESMPEIDSPPPEKEEEEQPNVEEQTKGLKHLPKIAHRWEKLQEKDKQTEFRTKKGTKQTSGGEMREATPGIDSPPPEEEEEQPNIEELSKEIPKIAHRWEKLQEKDRQTDWRAKKGTKQTSGGEIDSPPPEEEQPNIEEHPKVPKPLPKIAHRWEKLEEKDKQTKKGTKQTPEETKHQKETREPTPDENEQPNIKHHPKPPLYLGKLQQKESTTKKGTKRTLQRKAKTSPNRKTREPTPEIEEEEDPPKALKPLPKNILSCIKQRLTKAEEKDRRYTDEIIRTVDKAMNHLFNHLQRKDGGDVLSYLKTAEEFSTNFQTEIEDLNVRTKRIQRAILYFKEGCSVGDFCEFLNCNFTKVREGLKDLKEGKDSRKTVERVCDRLSNLIGNEVEKSFKAEWILKRERLLKCASILGTFEPDI